MKGAQFIILYVFIYFLLQSCNSTKKDKGNIETEKDSVSIWMKKSKDSKNNLSIRKKYLDKSYNSILSNNIDSTSLKNLSDLAYQTFKIGDTSLFKKRNKKVIQLALKIKDSFSLGDAHWNYASYYNKIKVYDSAYYHFNKAEKYFINNKKQKII